MDLAAYVLQVVTGRPLEEYLRERLFTPLGMSRSTVDRGGFLADADRTFGHMVGLRDTVFPGPALASAGLYSGAAELARFVQMNLNDGRVNGAPLVGRDLVNSMAVAYGWRGLASEPEAYCGLGVMLKKVHQLGSDRAALLVYHSGGGAGCTTLIYWFPEYSLGGSVSPTVIRMRSSTR